MFGVSRVVLAVCVLPAVFELAHLMQYHCIHVLTFGQLAVQPLPPLIYAVPLFLSKPAVFEGKILEPQGIIGTMNRRTCGPSICMVACEYHAVIINHRY